VLRFCFAEDDSAVEEKDGNKFHSIASFYGVPRGHLLVVSVTVDMLCQDSVLKANPAMAFVSVSAGGEDDGTGKGECERQEGRSRAAPVGQRHVVNL
jgi:hypothetical protein